MSFLLLFTHTSQSQKWDLFHCYISVPIVRFITLFTHTSLSQKWDLFHCYISVPIVRFITVYSHLSVPKVRLITVYSLLYPKSEVYYLTSLCPKSVVLSYCLLTPLCPNREVYYSLLTSLYHNNEVYYTGYKDHFVQIVLIIIVPYLL